MKNFYDWNPQHFEVFLTIITVSVGFAIHWFWGLNEKFKNSFFDKHDHEKAWIRYIFFQKVIAFTFMGLIPGLIILNSSHYSLETLGFRMTNLNESLVWTLVIGGVFVLSNYYLSRKPNNLVLYPQMRLKTWNHKRILINYFAWTLSLIASEFMYRGLLLVICNDTFGFWPAVAINLAFYSATHIGKGIIETFGSFPYGLALCFVTISTGSLFFAIATHLILAFTNDYFSIRHNPEMKYV